MADSKKDEEPKEDAAARADKDTAVESAKSASIENAASGIVPAEASSEQTGSDSGDIKATEDIEQLLDQATENLDAAAGNIVTPNSEPEPFGLKNLVPETDSGQSQPIDFFGEVDMDLWIELGRTEMRLEEVLELKSGSVVALDKLAGDPVDVFVNGRLVARGEVLVMNDNFCIRVTELVGA